MKVHQLKIGALLSYANIIISIVTALLYTPIMIRLLGQSEYGLYSLVGALVGYLNLLDLGLGNAVIRYIARNRAIEDDATEARLIGMFQGLYSLIGVLTILIGAIIYNNLENVFESALSGEEMDKARIMVMLLIFNIAVSFPMSIFASIIQAYERFVFLRVASIARSIINPCVMLPLLYYGYGSVSMVVINTIINLVFLTLNCIYCCKVLKIRFRYNGIDLKLLKQIVGYSFFVFLNVIVDKVYWSTGQLILGVVSGTNLVAVYSIAMQLIAMYIMFSLSINGVLLPRITMMVANNCSKYDLSQMMVKMGRLQYVIMAYILCGFILFGQVFITMWAGSAYSIAYYSILIIMIPITIPMIQNTGITILQAQNKNAFRSSVYVVIAIFNVIVSIPLAKQWGAFGCALATSVSLTLGNVIVMNIYYYREIGLDMVYFWRNIAKMTIPIALALLFGLWMGNYLPVNNFLQLAGNIALFSIIYIFFMWILGLNQYEKQLFLSPVESIINLAFKRIKVN